MKNLIKFWNLDGTKQGLAIFACFPSQLLFVPRRTLQLQGRGRLAAGGGGSLERSVRLSARNRSFNFTQFMIHTCSSGFSSPFRFQRAS